MIYLVTPAFCKAKLLKQCLEHLYQLPNLIPSHQHVIIDNHYPVDKEWNRHEILSLAKLYGSQYIDSGKDLGLHEGLNNAVKQLGIGPNDSLIGCDPDDRPEVGIFQAMIDVMNTDPKLAVLSGMFWVIEHKLKEPGFLASEKEIAGHKVLIHQNVEMFNVAAFNMKFIHSIGGFKQTYDYYGGIEAALYFEWIKQGMYMGYLKDYWTESRGIIVDRNDRTLFDPEYRAWKNDQISREFNGSFEQWLIHHGKTDDILGNKKGLSPIA